MPAVQRPVATATFSAFLALAVQVGLRAVRDALFLSRYDVSSLPLLVAVASLVSMFGAFQLSRLMTRHAPGRVVPLLNVASAVLFVIELLADAAAPRAVAVALYLHFSVGGALLVSGFWSIVNERFDPRSARRHIGVVNAGAALGGIFGPLMASLVPSPRIVLGALAALQLVLAWQLRGLARPSTAKRPAAARSAPLSSSLRALRSSPQLLWLSLLVVLGTSAAGLLDFAFKATAVHELGRGDAVLRFFAIFYAASGVVTFILQSFAGRAIVSRLGPAGTLAALPAGVVVAGAGAVVFGGLVVQAVARGVEQVLRYSLFRSGYELLFAPVPEADKRATKTLIDVGVDRIGDMLGALVVSSTVAAGAASGRLLLGGAVVLSLLALLVTMHLRRGQQASLARSLRVMSPKVDVSLVSLNLSGALPRPATPRPASPAPAVDPVIAALRSRDPERVRATLAAQSPLPLAYVGHVVPLLGWDDVAPAATEALSAIAPRIAGRLLDHLLHRDEEFAVRRRLPAVLEHAPGPLTALGLTLSLDDPRFEVRFRCARVLGRLRRRDPQLALDGARLLAAARRELGVEAGVWESQRLLDGDEGEGVENARSLEHVFRLLSLAFPGEPLALAFRGAGGTDAHLRGTALEYLETALPEDVRRVLWPYLETDRLRGAS